MSQFCNKITLCNTVKFCDTVKFFDIVKFCDADTLKFGVLIIFRYFSVFRGTKVVCYILDLNDPTAQGHIGAN